jgi:outer membrane protein TolC
VPLGRTSGGQFATAAVVEPPEINMNQSFRRGALAVALASALGGCATLSPQPDATRVSALLEARGSAVPAALTTTSKGESSLALLLSAPLGRDTSLAIALRQSPQLHAAIARLGLERADVIEAVEIANPGLSVSRTNLSPGEGYNQTAGISLPFVDVLLLPLRSRWARHEYERLSLETAQAVIGLTAEVEAAWVRAVAAQQVADMRAAVADGADAAAELAQRFFDAGNISELQLKREQAAASQAKIDAARSRAEALRERLAFGNLLGLGPEDGVWSLADRLPLPVRQEDDVEALLALAERSNLELQAARLLADRLRSSLKATRATRWVGGMSVGAERKSEVDGSRLTGPSVGLELPIFNQGQSKLARAQAQLADAEARLRAAELGTRNAVRVGARALADHREIVEVHRTALIPQRERIVKRSQQEQNFMLIGVFELVQAKVEEYDAYQAYLESVRDYWLARIELSRLVGQRLPSESAQGEATPSVIDILTPDAPAMPGMDHNGHDMPTQTEAPMDHSMHATPGREGAAAETPKDAEAPTDHSMHAMPAMDHSAHGAASTAAPENAATPPAEDEKPADTPEDHRHHPDRQGDTP